MSCRATIYDFKNCFLLKVIFLFTYDTHLPSKNMWTFGWYLLAKCVREYLELDLSLSLSLCPYFHPSHFFPPSLPHFLLLTPLSIQWNTVISTERNRSRLNTNRDQCANTVANVSEKLSFCLLLYCTPPPRLSCSCLLWTGDIRPSLINWC